MGYCANKLRLKICESTTQREVRVNQLLLLTCKNLFFAYLVKVSLKIFFCQKQADDPVDQYRTEKMSLLLILPLRYI